MHMYLAGDLPETISGYARQKQTLGNDYRSDCQCLDREMQLSVHQISDNK